MLMFFSADLPQLYFGVCLKIRIGIAQGLVLIILLQIMNNLNNDTGTKENYYN